MSDISFQGVEVVLDGANTRLRTPDLLLDAPSRRVSGSGHRRALVHDFNDGLTMNFLGDYPGGVAISGLRTVTGFNGNDRINVVSRVVMVAGSDFMLDSPSRRGQAGGFRRALVHDSGDGLTINFAGDYPSGVTLVGLRSVTGPGGDDVISITSRVLAVAGSDVILDAASRRVSAGGFRRALVHDFGDRLTLNFNRDYPGGVTINGKVEMPDGATLGGVDPVASVDALTAQLQAVTDQLAAAAAEIAALTDRVTALEAA